MPTAEIIAIGSELLTPTKTDTNSLWLTERLNEIGVEVRLKTVVGDDEARLEEAIRDAVKRSDVVITTGGLGPTEDDITRKIVARALDRNLVLSNKILEDLENKFKTFGYEMPSRNRSQAYLIEDAEVLPNPNGTAIGMLIETAGFTLIVLPGPPRENQPMFSDFALPHLTEKAGEISVRRKILRVVGLGESLLDEKVAPLYTKYQNPQTSILFNKTEVEIQLTASAKNAEKADELNEKLANEILEVIGENVFSTDGRQMEEVVADLLVRGKLTLSTAESCTGGLIAMRLTDVPGSSAYFVEGEVSYANAAKTRSLGVAKNLIETHGAVSSEVAEAMATGIRNCAETDFAVSTTGIAGPTGGTVEKPVGTVYIAIATASGVYSKKFVFPGDRYLIRWRASQAALELLRREVLKNGRK